MLLGDIPMVSFVDIMHTCVNQTPYYYLVILERSVLDFWGRCRLFWRDRSGMVRSLFYHEKRSHELICLQNILSTTPTLWGQVALWEMDYHNCSSYNICPPASRCFIRVQNVTFFSLWAYFLEFWCMSTPWHMMLISIIIAPFGCLRVSFWAVTSIASFFFSKLSFQFSSLAK